MQLLPDQEFNFLLKLDIEEEDLIKLGRLHQSRLPLNTIEFVPCFIVLEQGSFNDAPDLKLQGVCFDLNIPHMNSGFKEFKDFECHEQLLST